MTKFFIGLLFSSLCVSCVSTQNQVKKTMSHSQSIHQAPSVVAGETQHNKIPNNTSKKLVVELFLIENAFLEQNCDSVLEHTKILLNIPSSPHLNQQPPLVQAAVYTCDAKAGLKDTNRLQSAILNLKSLSLRYPVVNEAWLHNILGDFYGALNDKENAIYEKKQARDILLSQQQDISNLNMDILKLNPNEQNILAPSSSSKSEPSSQTQTIEQILASATQLINNDSPEQALSLLDNIPVAQRTESVKRIRTEAINNLVSNLRFKVRALFVRSTEQTGQVKKESLQQCEQILKAIVQNYPNYQDMPAVLNNLKQVQRELNKL